ncbi:pantoate-beta-alanine ligase [Candidozyma duobushaemuli]|uniref:Pantoate--beta-alanine ligase n=1 Tax=Candidozyma duobushaemuli TaxID=1231522 RepID=A0A2V1AG98_9ASCO|nr:pantoate-beta-alanine ligase [[Candida] duobushaemulonis]PVH17110.1 pantoate-beta-alanine ligase [[Candida] duobushaemulonis]
MTTSIKILRTVGQVRAWQKQCFFNKETVGFVPTMGALHQGHTYLVNQSLKENDRTIVSIFVNPSQFAPHEDLDAYPRTIDHDLQALESLDRPVDALFLPKVSEMFPSGIVLDVAKQKGAFVNGVSTIVTKLLNVIQPTNAYFGQKDAQQCVVVKNLVKDLLIDTTIRVCPTLREPNGLAMSSRNAYLSQEAKDQCSIIYKGLCAGRDYYEEEIKSGKPVSAAAVADVIREVFSSMPKEWNLEYIAVSHPESLEDLNEIESGVGATVSTAVRVPKSDGSGTARLIDNVQLNG